MIDIAVGRSRKEDSWANKKVSWEWLISKTKKTHFTNETYAEYTSASKDRQDEIKDIGGFVGGYLIGGDRKKNTVKHRQLITLDVDFANTTIWDVFCMLYAETALIYSTHKHSKKTPRYRLILPLSRPVSPEEYEAITRKIAGNLGLKHFDPTTFQPERLMYWPSTAKDGVYYFQHQEGNYLDADETLNAYRDWKDISEWPQCPSEKKAVDKLLKKQENPTEKKNWIGAFCRCYPISAAIDEFLSDIYEPCADTFGSNIRYSYAEGSTAMGAIVYDDLYLYSHHSSDPVSGQLCNSFDLVRVHLYGDLDTDLNAPMQKRESYKKMIGLLNSLGPVIRELGEFAGLTPGDWLAEMDITHGGEYKDTIDNVLLIIQNDDNIKDAFAHNLFDSRDYVMKAVPWNKQSKIRAVTDRDDAGLRHYLEKTYKIFQISKTKDAIDIALDLNSFHPVKDYLDNLGWDGIPRLESLFIDSLGSEDTEYTRAVTKKAFTAAVARIYHPGCKYDYVLTLVGPQGLGKSTIIREMGKAWYSDTMGNIHTKEAYEQLQGVWLLEIGELAGLKKAEVETIKNFISKQVDRYRVAYGKRAEDFLRQCVFFATTNEIGFLRDPTGGRRFWPVTCELKYKHNTINVDQLWAEAKECFKNEEDLYLNEALEAEAAEKQKQHAEVDERKGVIQEYLDTFLPVNWENMSIYERRSFIATEPFECTGVVERGCVCAAEIWCEALKCEYKDMSTFNTKSVHALMQNMEGWERCEAVRYPIYGYQRTYKRIGGSFQGKKRKAVRVVNMWD